MNGWHLSSKLHIGELDLTGVHLHAPSWHSAATWLTLVSLVMLILVLISLYRTNRLFYHCLLGVTVAHIAIGGGLWVVSHIKTKPPEIRVEIAARIESEPPKEEPKPEPVKPLDIPLGRSDGDRNVTKVRKGTTTKATKVGKPGDKSFGNNRTLSTHDDTGAADVYDDPLAGKDIFGGGDSLNPDDIRKMGKGGGGDDWGVKDGDPNGGIPQGFSDGKVGGRVYFIRLKYGDGSGDWNAFDIGTKRLLGFLSPYFPCETDSRAMTSLELRDRYLRKGAQPRFLYLYCGRNFTLSKTDVQVLQEYMKQGGFLFLDSRQEREIKSCVAREMGRVMSGARLTPIASKHPINRFLFKLAGPGVGENLITKENYGIERDGRYVVFYTMGNFSHLYAGAEPNKDPYAKVTYQMGANVMVYAINRGKTEGIVQQEGARAKLTTQSLERIFASGKPTPQPTTEPGQHGDDVKVKRPPPDGANPADPDMPDEPDEIKLLD